MTPAPPALARRLFRFACPLGERVWLLGDVDEEFARRAAADGASAARRWYWRQALSSFGPLLRRRFTEPRASLPKRTPPRGRSIRDELLSDFRYAVRMSWRRPWLTAAVVATMVLGIGASTAVFSVVHGVLLEPLPFDGSERAVRMKTAMRTGAVVTVMSYPDLQDFRREATHFSAFTAVTADEMTLLAGGEAERVRVASVDSLYARVFSIRPALGRLFTPEEFAPGGERIGVLSHRAWRDRFGGDPAIVGRTVALDGESYRVIGVLSPASYLFPFPDTDLLAPLRIGSDDHAAKSRGMMWLEVVGVARPDRPLGEAIAQLRSLDAVLAARFPDEHGGLSLRPETLHAATVGPVRHTLLLLGASVIAVLLVACLNIGNLLLGQAYTRTREFAVRAAVGGSQVRIRRQILSESLLLAAVGGAVGAALAPLIVQALIAIYPGQLPRGQDVRLDGTVMIFAIAATALAGVLSGLPTARRAAMLDLTHDLREGSRSTGSPAQRRVSRALVGVQIGVSVALVFAAGLLLRTFDRLSHVDPGFDPRGVTTFSVAVSNARYPKVEQVQQFFDGLETSLRAVPGVADVGITTDLPFVEGYSHGDVVFRDDRPLRDADKTMISFRAVSPGYFSALGIRPAAGRSFTALDRHGAPLAVVLNDVLARQLFPGENPVGKMVYMAGIPHWTVVGIVPAFHSLNLWEPPRAELYAAAAQLRYYRQRFVVVKAGVPPDRVIAAARRAVLIADPSVAVTEVRTMESRVAESLVPQRFRAVLIGGLGFLALALSTLGVYGVVAYAVTRQTKEIGIRMALGESQAAVRRRVVVGALRLAVGGTVFGVVLALGAGRSLASLLVGVNQRDPWILGLVAATLVGVTVVAAYGPARRASRIDPLTALREE